MSIRSTSTRSSLSAANQPITQSQPPIQLGAGSQSIRSTRSQSSLTAAIHAEPAVQPSNAPLDHHEQIIAIVRHGQTPDNRGAGETFQMPAGPVNDGPIIAGPQQTSIDKVLSGQNEVELTVEGWKQARDAGAQMLALLGPQRLATANMVRSPLPRVQQTFQGFTQGAGLTDVTLRTTNDPRLMERSAGRLTGLTRKDAAPLFPRLTTDAGPFKKADSRYPEGEAPDGKTYPGESLLDVSARAHKALEEHAQKGDTIVFTHEMTAMTIVEHLTSGCDAEKSCTTDDTLKLKIPNAGPIIFAKTSNGWVRVEAPRPQTDTGESSRLAA